MRIAVISDIHGNLEALEATLKRLKELTIDEYICLGDIVGYGANPNECVKLVRELTDHVIVGNHDHAAVGLTDISLFNPFARQAVVWTSGQLTSDNKDYLKRLPFTLKRDKAIFVHSTPDRPQEWKYVFSLWEARWYLDQLEEQLCFIGHSHYPFICVKGREGQVETKYSSAVIDQGTKYLINVGSVGQPRDHDPRSSFAVIDDEAETVEILRTSYDVARAQEKIREAGLPEILADRLGYGE